MVNIQDEADVVIVGAGAVGLTLAIELARAGKSVILLEAGDQSLTSDSQRFFHSASWKKRSLPGLHHGRFRMLGGTTNFWGGQLVEFDDIVFEHRSWISDRGWPISREDLAPFYLRSYDLLGIRRRLSSTEIWDRLKQVPLKTTEDLEAFFTAWAPEPNFVKLFEREIAQTPNLSIQVNSPVVALQMNGAMDAVTKLTVRGLDQIDRVVSGGTIVLAHGTIEIARLLKLPLSDGQSAPWSQNSWLGCGFLDHVDCYAGNVFPLDHSRFHSLFDNAYLDNVKYVPKLKLSEAAQRKHELLGIAAHFIFRSRFDEHLQNSKKIVRSLLRAKLGEFFSLRNLVSVLMTVRVILPMVIRYVRHQRMYNLSDGGVILRLTGEHAPLRESRLRLLDDVDSLGMPLIEMDWRVSDRTFETISYFSERISCLLEEAGVAKVELDKMILEKDAEFLDRSDDANHHMGMVRMAASSADGVVDKDLRVFGVRNLFVAGAAVFPTSGFANPTLTAIALGLRLADQIIRR